MTSYAEDSRSGKLKRTWLDAWSGECKIANYTRSHVCRRVQVFGVEKPVR